MGDKQKKPAEKKAKKKLEINKETVKELTDEELGDVAGGLGRSAGCAARDVEGDLAAPKGTRHCVTVSCNCY